MRLKGSSSVDLLSSDYCLFHSFYFLLHFLFYSFHSLFWSSVWMLAVIKSSDVVFDKINAKTLVKIVLLMLPMHIWFPYNLLTLCPPPPLHSKCFRGYSLVVKTHLNVLQIPFVGILISRKVLCIKVRQRLCIVFQY